MTMFDLLTIIDSDGGTTFKVCEGQMQGPVFPPLQRIFYR